MTRFEGKTVVVTGGARGMGAAHSRGFVAEGARVVIADVLDAEGEELAGELGEAALYRHLDVTDEQQWAEVVRAATAAFSAPTVLVNNAGIGGSGTLVEDKTLADWRKLLAVNLDGVFLGTRAVIPGMKAAGGGAIVNISSFAGLIGTPNAADYTTSKFAVRGFTKAVAMEVAPYGIRVNSVHPGYIRTPILGPLGDEVVHGKVALDRMAGPEEVTRMVLFVASDDASYSTGAEFVIDGGWSAGSTVGIGQTNAQYYQQNSES
ncbi:3-alpha-(or 20-beta)-hydroxysteroid dehydrogenase [Kineosporia sp. NBRC 101677]|uniref:SDR family oxidoreductase n=1 Tax=Kineosporia sp. NBRC 101677 TaxID=3032197 RepID=UPI0024A1EBD1|nr:SDR family oxidoreductase [Kineosporia sp. NBRC 101677]GLY17163.1 3-alpha-(or 20-beta)-hydroxysteroid dehydrogenase [Kineosporia sp. NBRC 101677]